MLSKHVYLVYVLKFKTLPPKGSQIVEIAESVYMHTIEFAKCHFQEHSETIIFFSNMLLPIDKRHRSTCS